MAEPEARSPSSRIIVVGLLAMILAGIGIALLALQPRPARAPRPDAPPVHKH